MTAKQTGTGSALSAYPGFPHQGEVVFESADGKTFRLQDYHVRARSLVFDDMLEYSSPKTSGSIPLDVNGKIAALFLYNLIGKRPISIEYTWREAKQALDLCRKYDVTSFIDLIANGLNTMQAPDLFEAFAAASAVEDRLAGYRLLRWGALDPRRLFLLPVPHGQLALGWSPAQSRRISPEWIVSLWRAIVIMDQKLKDKRHTEAYWHGVAFEVHRTRILRVSPVC